VTRAKGTFQSRIVQAQDLDGRATDISQAAYEKVVVDKDEMLWPEVVPGIEEPCWSAASIVRDPLTFVFIAKLTRLTEVVDVVVSSSPRSRPHS